MAENLILDFSKLLDFITEMFMICGWTLLNKITFEMLFQ